MLERRPDKFGMALECENHMKSDQPELYLSRFRRLANFNAIVDNMERGNFTESSYVSLGLRWVREDSPSRLQLNYTLRNADKSGFTADSDCIPNVFCGRPVKCKTIFGMTCV
jgi:hypothetical protein